MREHTEYIVLAKVYSGAISGLTAIPVVIEVDIASQGLPSFTIVGLPDKAIEESKERVRAAIRNSGAEFPAKRITVNLAPADLPKNGPAYDIPIALGILLASGQVQAYKEKSFFVGEVSLDGSLRHTNGILTMAMLAHQEKVKAFFVPSIDAEEAAIITGVDVYPVDSLLALFHHIMGNEKIIPVPHTKFSEVERSKSCEFDFEDIVGQEQAKRAIEVAVAGGHNIFMQGPPGAGKTMLARAIPSIMPTLTEEEAVEVTKIYSVTGNLPQGQSLIVYRPFRAPHHTTSRVGLIGGGTHPTPGEISLAHRGVLFCDEFPEFPRHVLEALRQPMEDGVVTIARAAGSMMYPAQFMLVASANPCPCGNFGSSTKRCVCTMQTVNRYRSRVSGPIMDRIDLHVQVPAVSTEKLTSTTRKAEASFIVRERIGRARNIQMKRYVGTKILTNAELSTQGIKLYCSLDDQTITFLRTAVKTMGLSARSYYRVIKVSRTIADIEGAKNIQKPHVAEALQYRPKELE